MADQIENIIIYPNPGFDTGQTSAEKINAAFEKLNKLPSITDGENLENEDLLAWNQETEKVEAKSFEELMIVKARKLTGVEYEALTTEEKNNGVIYFTIPPHP